MFGAAYTEAGDVEAGLRWYEAAVKAADGRTSLKAAEQLPTSAVAWRGRAWIARNGTWTRCKCMRQRGFRAGPAPTRVGRESRPSRRSLTKSHAPKV